MRTTCPAREMLLDLIILVIYGEEYKLYVYLVCHNKFQMVGEWLRLFLPEYK
jgi:hypothetical protein